MSNKKKRRVRKRYFLLLLIVVIAALFVRSDWIGRLIYPISYQADITTNAQKYGQDPLLIAAIIRVESNYSENAVSGKGAIGIMQLMPDTASWILTHDRFGSVTVEEAGRNAHAGIMLGTWYVKELNRQFKGNLPAVLAAYNAGPNKVRQWLNDGTWDGSEASLSNIPYGETRHYVQRVIYYYKKYQRIYPSL